MRKAYVEFQGSGVKYGMEMQRVSDSKYTLTYNFASLPIRPYTVRVSAYSQSYKESACSIARMEVVGANGQRGSAATTVNFIPSTADFTYNAYYGQNTLVCYSQKWDTVSAGDVYAIVRPTSGQWAFAMLDLQNNNVTLVGTQPTGTALDSASFKSSAVDSVNQRFYAVATTSSNLNYLVVINTATGEQIQATQLNYALRSISFNLEDGNLYGLVAVGGSNGTLRNVVRVDPLNPTSFTVITITPIRTGGCSPSSQWAAVNTETTIDQDSNLYFTDRLCVGSNTYYYVFGISLVDGSVIVNTTLTTQVPMVAYDRLNGELYGMSQFGASFQLATISAHTGLIASRTDNGLSMPVSSTNFAASAVDYMNQKYVTQAGSQVVLVNMADGTLAANMTLQGYTVQTMDFQQRTRCCLQESLTRNNLDVTGRLPMVDLSHVNDGCSVYEEGAASSVSASAVFALVAGVAAVLLW